MTSHARGSAGTVWPRTVTPGWSGRSRLLQALTSIQSSTCALKDVIYRHPRCGGARAGNELSHTSPPPHPVCGCVSPSERSWVWRLLLPLEEQACPPATGAPPGALSQPEPPARHSRPNCLPLGFRLVLRAARLGRSASSVAAA